MGEDDRLDSGFDCRLGHEKLGGDLDIRQAGRQQLGRLPAISLDASESCRNAGIISECFKNDDSLLASN
jgi:hypothetical protein